MKAIPGSKTIMFATAAFVAFCIGPALRADDHRHPCSLRGAAGAYGFSYTGTGLPTDPITGAGTFTLDKSGNIVDGTQTINFAGEVNRFIMSGTYGVNPDCTGSFSFDIFDPDGTPEGVFPFDAVWIDKMNEVRSISLDNGLIFIFDAKRLDGNGD